MLNLKSLLQILSTLFITYLLISCGGGINNNDTVNHNMNTDLISTSNINNCSIELNGDSILAGYGLNETPANYLLKINSNIKVDNRSVIGLTLNDLYNGYLEPFKNANPEYFPLGAQKPFMLENHNSKFVIIEPGANDSLTNTTPNQIEAQYVAIITYLQSLGITPVVTGIVKLPIINDAFYFTPEKIQLTEIYNNKIHEIAKKYNTLDAYWDTVDFNGINETIDGVHRNQMAQNRLNQRLYDTIKNDFIKNCN